MSSHKHRFLHTYLSNTSAHRPAHTPVLRHSSLVTTAFQLQLEIPPVQPILIGTLLHKTHGYWKAQALSGKCYKHSPSNQIWALVHKISTTCTTAEPRPPCPLLGWTMLSQSAPRKGQEGKPAPSQSRSDRGHLSYATMRPEEVSKVTSRKAKSVQEKSAVKVSGLSQRHQHLQLEDQKNYSSW